MRSHEVNKIILTRPAVEAGESLGYLPGDLKEKVDPYLTPIYDALHDILGKETTDKYLEKGITDIATFAANKGALFLLEELIPQVEIWVKEFEPKTKES